MLIKEALHEEIEKIPVEYLGIVLEQIKALGSQTKPEMISNNDTPSLEQVHHVTSKITNNWSGEISLDREERI